MKNRLSKFNKELRVPITKRLRVLVIGIYFIETV